MGIYAMTGGASGIGAAIKHKLKQQGHDVVVVDLQDADIQANLASAQGRSDAISAIHDHASAGLDGFIACAGVASHVTDLALISSVNYYGSVELVEGLQDLLAMRSGSVLMVSSNSAPMETNASYVDALLDNDAVAVTASLAEMQGQQVYSGSKQALARWMRRNTQRFAQMGIRMNAIAPGYTETPMTAAVAESAEYGDAIKQFLNSIPMGRAGLPEDMANAASFLLSDAASFICGSVLFIDGGHDAMLRPDAF